MKSVTTTLSVICITNNMPWKKPREPLVQLIGARYGAVNSLVFTPAEAMMVASAMVRAARGAKAGRKVAPRFVEVEND